MINISVVIFILFAHWFGDFVMQTDAQAKGKSTSNKALTMHVLSYCSLWLGICVSYSTITSNWLMMFFPVITFICHWITDYYTSRLNSKLYKAGRIHEFFVSVGFDQYLHFCQLLVTYYLLNSYASHT